MTHCFSTFKSTDEYNELNNQQTCVIVGNLNLQTSTFNIPKQNDNCDEYYGFLGQLKKLHDKVDSGDLSEFTALKLWILQVINSCQEFHDYLNEYNLLFLDNLIIFWQLSDSWFKISFTSLFCNFSSSLNENLIE